MSLIIPMNFKRAKAQDAAAQDIKLPFIITFNNGKKEFREGYSEEEVRRRFDKSVAALYGGIKSVKLEGEDRRDGKDSIAADAKFKVGDRVRLAGTASPALGKTGVVVKVDGEWGDVTVKTDDGKTYQYEASAVQKVADSRAADACGTDAKFQKGDKVRVWQQPVYGKMGEIVEATFGGMEYTVNVEGKDYPRIDYRRIVKMSDAAGDAANTSRFKPNDLVEWRDAHGRHNSAFYVRDNGDRITVSIEKNGHGGGLEIPKAWITNSRAEDASGTDANFKVGDKVKLSGSHPRFPNRVAVVTHVFPTGFVKVKVDGIEDIEIAERLISKAEDAAELRVVHAKGIGKWWVEPNLSRFNDADREQTHKGRKEFPDREAAMKYARGTGKTFIVNDACDATDANFKKGDKVTVKTKWAGTRKGIVKEVINDPALKKAYVVEIEGAETYAYPAEIVSADACEDSSKPNNDANDSAAKFRIGQEVIVKTKSAEPYKARIVGLWDMSQNGPYDEQGYLIKNIKGGGVESMPEHALSLVTAKDSAELNNDADLRAALSKMADIAKRLTDAKVSFKAGWTPEGIGEIILEFPNIESARKYNYYKLFNAWEAARSQIVPRWALNIGGYRVPRIEGNRMTISILHFST